MSIQKLRRNSNCPTCGATKSNWKKTPRDMYKLEKLTTLVSADQVDSFNPVDIFRCPHCQFMGVVYRHPEDAEGYIDWDNWEFTPSYCPHCGALIRGK